MHNFAEPLSTASNSNISSADIQARIADYLAEHPASSTRDIAEGTRLDRSKVIYLLAPMVAQCRVIHVGETKIAATGYAIPTYSLRAG